MQKPPTQTATIEHAEGSSSSLSPDPAYRMRAARMDNEERSENGGESDVWQLLLSLTPFLHQRSGRGGGAVNAFAPLFASSYSPSPSLGGRRSDCAFCTDDIVVSWVIWPPLRSRSARMNAETVVIFSSNFVLNLQPPSPGWKHFFFLNRHIPYISEQEMLYCFQNNYNGLNYF